MRRRWAILLTACCLLAAAALVFAFLAWRGLVIVERIPDGSELAQWRFWRYFLRNAGRDWPHYLLPVGAAACLSLILYRMFRGTLLGGPPPST